MSRSVLLGELITRAKVRRAGEDSLPILSMTMKHGLVDQSDKFKKRVASVDTTSYKRITRGQLVVGFPIDEGVLSFQDLYDEAIVSPAYDVWDVCRPDLVDRRYLELVLRGPEALAYYSTKLQSTTARRRTLPEEVFLNFQVCLPSLDQQADAVSLLEKVGNLQLKREQAIRTVGEFVRALFLDMFGEPCSNTKNFELGTIRDLVASANYGTSEKASEEIGEYPILRMNNITYEGGWDFSSLKYVDLAPETAHKYLAQQGDLLFNRTNSKELVGKTAVYMRDEPMAIAGYLVRVRMNERGNSHYVSGYLNSVHGKRTLETRAKSIVGMANINAQEMQDIPLLLPPIELQIKYAGIVEAVYARLETQQAFLRDAVALQSALSHHLFNSVGTEETATC